MAPALSIQSMTGFGRADGAGFGLRWSWELKSVNGKGLDIRFRGPPGSDAFEPMVRERVAAAMARGSIQANLVQQREAPGSSVRINREALAELAAAVRELNHGAPPAIELLLGIRGIVEVVEGEPATGPELTAAVVVSLDAAVAALAAARLAEGTAIVTVLRTRLDELARLTAAAETNPARTPEAIRARLAEQLAALMGSAPALDPDRLHQEAMLLAAKADIREELDRLTAHIAAARKLLAEGGAVGRKLDFLAQELNRETNTLCAKANDRSLTAIGLDLKAAVDQFREQIQNLE